MGRLDDARSLLREPSVFFDVGGNTGQTVAAFREAFPSVQIFSFEPVPKSFRALARSVAGDPLTRTFPLALSDSVRAVGMSADGTSPRNRVMVNAEAAILVETITGDIFCSEHAVTRISYLKIDAEGHDLAVLRGFRGMLSAGWVDMVEVEAGMNPGNKLHVDFTEFRAFLDPLGYYLYRIHTQVLERNRVHMRRCNPVFVSPTMKSPS